MRRLTLSFGGAPLLDAKLIQRALTSSGGGVTLVARITARDLATLGSTGELVASDGVTTLRVAGLVVRSRSDSHEGTVTIRAEAARPNITPEDLHVAARIGEALVLDHAAQLASIANTRAVVSSPQNTLAFAKDLVDAPISLRAIAPRVALHHRLSGPWTPMVRDVEGQWRELDAALAEWRINRELLHDLLLHPEDASKLGVSAGLAACIMRDAYRAFRFDGVVPSGQAQSLVTLQHDAFTAPQRPASPELLTVGPLREGAAMLAVDDSGRPIVMANRLLVHLRPKAKSSDVTTLHGYLIDRAATITATLAFIEERATRVATYLVGGTAPALEITFPSLLAFEDHAGGSTANPFEEAIRATALNALSEIASLLPSTRTSAEFSGPHGVLPTAFERVEMIANAESGMRTLVVSEPDWVASLVDAFDMRFAALSAAVLQESSLSKLDEPAPKPRNAGRGGPIILRDDANADHAEAASFTGLAAIDGKSDALELEHFGRLAQPFWVDDAKGDGGAWFFAAPIKLIDGGVALLDDRLSLADFAETPEVDVDALGDARAIPRGSDGLLLQGLDGQSHLALYDRALVAQHRGDMREGYSSAIREIEGQWLDPERQGALHQLTCVTLSPQAMRQSSGSGLASGWVAALNFRGASTSTPQERARMGHGRFAEGNGKSIGQLAHFPDAGGPLLADAEQCTKHALGESVQSDGVYRECAGHLATDAFFKMPGKPDYDAPFLFQPEPTRVGIGRGPEYRAEIKLNPEMTHRFEGRDVPGRWVVTYRVPLHDGEPPFWRPREDPPYVIDRNLAGPSYDWVPPDGIAYKAPPVPGEEDDLLEIPYPGAVLSATGYAVRSPQGHPTPANGGGVVLMPGGLFLRDGPSFEFGDSEGSEDASRWFVLHPAVGLGFGLPDMDVDGAPREGYHLRMIGEALVLSASEIEEGEDPPAATLRLTVPLDVEAGFGGTAPSVSGSRSDGSALAALLTALAARGLIVDASSA